MQTSRNKKKVMGGVQQNAIEVVNYKSQAQKPKSTL